MVKIGHARISEKGSVDGVKGDQTKHEVEISNWYLDKWIAVYRPKNTKHAEIIATKCEDACKNDCIGYSQYTRYSLFNLVCNNGYDIKNLKTPCNCDCSSLVMTCCRAAGITVPKALFTGTQDGDLMRTGNFEKLTGTKYTRSDQYLKRGDILLKQGHTAIVLTNGDGTQEKQFNASKSAAKFDRKLSGAKYAKVNANLRNGGSLNDYVLTVVPANTRVNNFGYYSVDNRGVKWLYCVYVSKSGTYQGFISEGVLR